MTSRERVLCTLRRGTPDRVPWIEHSITDSVCKTLVDDGDQITLAKKLGLDGITCMGLQPMIVHGLNNLDDWDKWRVTWHQPAAPIDKFVSDSHSAGLAAGFVGALGLGLLIHSFGVAPFNYMIQDEFNRLLDALDFITEWNTEFFKQLTCSGLDFIIAGTDLADNHGLMFPSDFVYSELFPRQKVIAKEITIPWIYHCCGNFNGFADVLMDYGCDGLEPFQTGCMDIVDFKRRYGSRIIVKGGVDVGIIARGTPEDVASKTQESLGALGLSGYIISSSHSIYEGCKPENVMAMSRVIMNQKGQA